MSFKAGDRVEVLPGPPNVDRPEAVGPGTIIDIYHRPTGETFYVQPDKGDSWYYSEDQLRPLTVHINPQTPTPELAYEDLVGLINSQNQELADKFRRLAAYSDLCAKAADTPALTALHSGQAHAFKQAAQMVEERLNG